MRRGLTVLALTAALLTGACTVAEEIQTDLFDTTKVNLTDSSYAAADMLAQQTRSRISTATPLRVAIITDVTTPAEITAFGSEVANELGSRFVQLGYNVQSVPLPPAAVATMTATGAPAPVVGTAEPIDVASNIGGPQITQAGAKPGTSRGECVLTGSYTRGKHTLSVSLKILQAPDDHIVAAYDYTLPLTRELNDLSASKAEMARRAKKLDFGFQN